MTTPKLKRLFLASAAIAAVPLALGSCTSTRTAQPVDCWQLSRDELAEAIAGGACTDAFAANIPAPASAAPLLIERRDKNGMPYYLGNSSQPTPAGKPHAAAVSPGRKAGNHGVGAGSRGSAADAGSQGASGPGGNSAAGGQGGGPSGAGGNGHAGRGGESSGRDDGHQGNGHQGNSGNRGGGKGADKSDRGGKGDHGHGSGKGGGKGR